MFPLVPSGINRISKENFILFRNPFYINNRLEELSKFCIANKRIINKMIKQDRNLFENDLKIIITYMPNFLDFENKRTYFKQQLKKLKGSDYLYGEQINLKIKRDEIFDDAYNQIKDKTAAQMKRRLCIEFLGE